ncbi:hypothetical protein JCGZ_22148 [Jatropha curcas]|uniref:Uncharacterized protein n=1 Tax=Jatropha curcas TaxID=180498 RepID=A0A067L7X6_JATCU|nr:hypothetical protein JCGZ_22148 [Jatropha curcas]
MYYLGERVYEWELGPDRRRVSHNVPYYMFSTWSIKLEKDIAVARRGSLFTDHLVAFVLGAYAIFVWTQLLVHVPPPSEFDPFNAKELDRDQGNAPTHVFIVDYNEVCQLYEAEHLKLVVARLSDEHVFTKLSLKNFPKLSISSPFFMDRSLAPVCEALFHNFSGEDWDLLSPFDLNGLSYYRNIWVQPRLLQRLINHFDPSDNLFCHNDFEIYPLFEEFSIISGRIHVTEEVLTVPGWMSILLR